MRMAGPPPSGWKNDGFLRYPGAAQGRVSLLGMMNSRFLKVLMVILAMAGVACNRAPDANPGGKKSSLAEQDTPLLAATPGDRWTYRVDLLIPAGATSPGSAEVEQRYERVRRFLGKVSPAKGLPEVDGFEVEVRGFPTEREFVDILPDAILMRGSLILREETTLPLWLSQPVPFVTAGLSAGDELPDVSAPDGNLTRQTRVVAREEITVPAGDFSCIRLLTTGMDGQIELRRTVWFSPGTGIIREEKTRHRAGKLLFSETQQLSSLDMATPNSR